ncbi:MAG: hypothetical protein U5K75_08705 [Ahrensia sp.]|nr:hypothetical protein [Ahrensia sp.]
MTLKNAAIKNRLSKLNELDIRAVPRHNRGAVLANVLFWNSTASSVWSRSFGPTALVV